jgi:hypothetical protein
MNSSSSKSLPVYSSFVRSASVRGRPLRMSLTRLKDVLLGEHPAIDACLTSNDFAGGKVAVFLCLDQRIFIERIAKVVVVVGSDFLIFGADVLRFVQLARRGGQADVDGIWVAF